MMNGLLSRLAGKRQAKELDNAAKYRAFVRRADDMSEKDDAALLATIEALGLTLVDFERDIEVWKRFIDRRDQIISDQEVASRLTDAESRCEKARSAIEDLRKKIEPFEAELLSATRVIANTPGSNIRLKNECADVMRESPRVFTDADVTWSMAGMARTNGSTHSNTIAGPIPAA